MIGPNVHEVVVMNRPNLGRIQCRAVHASAEPSGDADHALAEYLSWCSGTGRTCAGYNAVLSMLRPKALETLIMCWPNIGKLQGRQKVLNVLIMSWPNLGRIQCHADHAGAERTCGAGHRLAE